jgi:hypothetical protein
VLERVELGREPIDRVARPLLGDVESHRAKRGGIRARPLELGLVTTGEYDLVGFPEPPGNLQPMLEPGRRTRA